MSCNPSDDGEGDSHKNLVPQMLDNTTVNMNNAQHDAGRAGPSPGVGKTFVVDPEVMAQWSSGHGGTSENGVRDGKSRSTNAAGNEKVDAKGNSAEKFPADQDHLAPGDSAEVGVASVKKKSRKKKSKSKRGLAAPTGFEEFYVDAPLTPAEFDEEKGLYDPRIETAIQRYCARRNLDSKRKDVFDKYLSLGGISSGPKQFSGGLDAKDLSDMNAAEIALMKATHFVDVDKWGPEEAYQVDFEGCVKSFFSSRVPEIYDLSGVDCVQQVKSKTNVVRNFLNYLLHHEVCPEYQAQVHAAKAVCDKTDNELPRVTRARSYFPGDFQTACSEIFGGAYRGTSGQNVGWAIDVEGFAGMSPELAKQTFKVGMATHVPDEMAKAYMEQGEALSITTTKAYNAGLEVTELVRASDEVKRFYERHPAAKGLKSLGRLITKSWIPPYRLQEDLTEEEKKLAETNPAGVVETHSFLVEDYVLETCFVGMKFEATIREMSFGLKFFDTTHGVFCSFYTLLPNELMIGWRVPEAEPLPYRGKNDATVAMEDDFDDVEEDMDEKADFQQEEHNDTKDAEEGKEEESAKTVPSIKVSEAWKVER
ncbi:MAG: hypothetical protein Q9188_002064 [Gyalolechia gomerana]